MKTLWQKNTDQKDSSSESDSGQTWFYRFTAEEDRELDRHLIPYDILVNIAQASMLKKIGVYNQKGHQNVTSALQEMWKQWETGHFDIGSDDEDVHSAVEKYLTDKVGQDGARIHTGRSRNDQVLADMRLYMKASVLNILGKWIRIAKVLIKLGESQKGVYFSGLTHTQPAMPHTVDAWASGYLDILSSDLEALSESYSIIDQSPLGSAAGYGVPFIKIDREYIAEKLGFAKVQEAVAAPQLSRGRFEMQFIDALSYGALTFNRMASDIVLFMHPSLGFVTLSEDQVSGSSIMPQKRNPDAWELIRAAYHDFQAARVHLSGISANLVSGYHRDLQAVKKTVMTSVLKAEKLADAVFYCLSGLTFDEKRAAESLTKEVFATHYANQLVSEGKPFREAYREVAEMIRPERTDVPRQEKPGSINEKLVEHGYFHSGAPGSGIPAEIKKKIDEIEHWAHDKQKQRERIQNALLS